MPYLSYLSVFCPAAPTENASIYEPTLLESRARAWVPSCSRPTWLCCSDARSVLSFLYATSVSRFSKFVSVISLVSLSLSLSPYLSTSLSVSLVFSFFLFLSFPLSNPLLSFASLLLFLSLYLSISLALSSPVCHARATTRHRAKKNKIVEKNSREASKVGMRMIPRNLSREVDPALNFDEFARVRPDTRERSARTIV